MREDPGQDRESLRQLNLIYSGLIGIGAVWVQPFLTAPSLDLSATICVVAFIGVVAGFWHVSWVAGVGMLASGLVAVAVHSAGYWRLERDRLLAQQEPEEPGDPEA